MKRRAALVLAITIVLVLCACGTPKTSEQPITWTVQIEGADKDAFTNADYAKLYEVTVTAVKKKSDGTETEQTWKGVLLKDVIEYLGVKEYSTITLTASDDYSKDYTEDIVNDEKTILATILEGEPLGEEGGFVRAVAGNQSGNMWISNLVKIRVNK